MPSSFICILLYSVIAIQFYATPQGEDPSKEDVWAHRIIGIVLAVIMLSCIPWFISDISGSNERWPEILHDVVVGSVLLVGLFAYLLYRRKK